MKKFKVCVYAISKNEEKFVDRWYESMKEADEIYALDTGSTDNTFNLLKEKGVHVKKKKISPWRFDVARNESLKLLPDDTDICVCTDLDEVFNKGWRKELEKVWEKNTNRCRYTYNWSLDKDNKPLVSFLYEKIHSRNGYKWIYPVHEVLEFDNDFENVIVNENIILNHYPDSTKSRSSYLPLLELSVKENPKNDRNMHYLGREYMYYGKYNEAIDTLIKHLHLKNATWKDERCASMRFIARCYKYLKRYDEAQMWLLKAIKEAPYLRDPFIELALLYYELNDFQKVYDTVTQALEIKYHQKTYNNEIFSWNETPYDLLSISCFNLGKYDESLEAINHALEISPYDERILKNKEIILNKLDI